MKRCATSRCHICKFVKEGRNFSNRMGNKKYFINYDFDCESRGIVYLLECEKCCKQYIGSTTTSFRKRFNNHKSSLVRYGMGQRGIPGKHLYEHVFEGHKGFDHVMVNIVDKTDFSFFVCLSRFIKL